MFNRSGWRKHPAGPVLCYEDHSFGIKKRGLHASGYFGILLIGFAWADHEGLDCVDLIRYGYLDSKSLVSRVFKDLLLSGQADTDYPRKGY